MKKFLKRFIGNFIDTAEAYPVPPSAELCGKTEEIIGNCLEKILD